MITLTEKSFLDEVAEKLELPESAYLKAEERYKDLGQWLCREESSCEKFSPHIYPQGSFRLGTATRPLNSKEEYDLDLSCNLQEGISKTDHTQKELKHLVGIEIESYRIARRIKEELEEKKRCWRLEYADQIKFHLDIVPCIPENEERRQIIKKSILLETNDEFLSDQFSGLAVAITDNTHPEYYRKSNNWNISNPEGYAKWFESRMKLASKLLSERSKLLKSATIDKLPNYQWKTPLQICIQLLKRHRDIMFKEDPDVKPISIIITTLAGRAYQGENDLENTILNILNKAESLISLKSPRITNPVNPSEDFTDKWNTKAGLELKLENNFWNWLTQAKIDFKKIYETQNANHLIEQCMVKFGIRLDKSDLGKRLSLGNDSNNIFIPKHHNITEKSKPWKM